jgi:peptidoglycan/xylan/chitin deacetylase (PgdA/CDA1 family)
MRMSRTLSTLLALAALLLALDAIPHSRAPERAVAVTFDDLPAPPAGVVANDVASLQELTRKLLSAVRKHAVPAVGFVNEGKLFVEGPGTGNVDSRIGVLRMWLDAGLELGNHTYSHRDLNTMPLDQFQADVLRGETVTRGLLQGTAQRLRYFRHPFLHVGSDLKVRRACSEAARLSICVGRPGTRRPRGSSTRRVRRSSGELMVQSLGNHRRPTAGSYPEAAGVDQHPRIGCI